jgi:hypothetical protein
MTPRRAPLFALLVAAASGGLVACGGGTSSSPPPSEPAAETFSEVSPEDVAALEGAPPAETPAAEAAAAPEEPADECSPVGVELEKSVRPQLKECYRAGKKKDANLEGTVRIALEIDMLGKLKTLEIAESTLPDAVAKCMLKAVKAAPKTELTDKCRGKAISIPVTFPTPR